MFTLCTPNEDSCYPSQTEYKLHGDLCGMAVKQGCLEPPGDSYRWLVDDIKALQQNLRAQGSADHWHAYKVFSLPIFTSSVIFWSTQKQFTNSNEHPTWSVHFSTSVEVLISERRQLNVRLKCRKWFLTWCNALSKGSKHPNILKDRDPILYRQCLLFSKAHRSARVSIFCRSSSQARRSLWCTATMAFSSSSRSFSSVIKTWSSRLCFSMVLLSKLGLNF